MAAFECPVTHHATPEGRPFEFVLLDVAQDVSVPQLRFLASLAGAAANTLFGAGDLGQRIL